MMDQTKLVQNLTHLEKVLKNEIRICTGWAAEKIAGESLSQGIEKNLIAKVKQLKDEEETGRLISVGEVTAIDTAMDTATQEIDEAIATIETLQEEGFQLSDQIRCARTHDVNANTNCDRALNEEQKLMQNIHEIEVSKSLLLEEYTANKKEISELDEQKALLLRKLKQTEYRLILAQNERERIISEADATKKHKEKNVASSEREMEYCHKIMKEERRKYAQQIRTLEKKKLKLKFEVEQSTSPSLREGVTALKVSPMEKHVWRGWECIVCMSSESSVLFLPCKHMILCLECNELPCFKNMMECPMCSAPIKQCVLVRYQN